MKTVPAARRFVIGCGGTGGHIYPGIALARELSLKGAEILFIGNRKGMEDSLVRNEGFDFSGIRVQKLYRSLSLSNLLFPFLLLSSTLSSLRIMRQFRPDGVICTGGFVSGPVALAAIILRLPLYFHESNSFPGLTTRWLAKYTRITFISFAKTAQRLRKTKTLNLGIPLAERKTAEEVTDPSKLGLDPAKPILLVTGGSQGSQAINAAVAGALPQILANGLQLIWQTGKSCYKEYSGKFSNQPGVFLFDFSPLLASYYKLAKLALTRAGAMTLSELETNRLPAILVPLPSAAENHQYYNALVQQERGLAILLKQSDLTPQNLLDAIHGILEKHAGYIFRLGQLAPNTASSDITRAILNDLDKENNHAWEN
ncbi:MAG: undecaprenyldiphospho-muramoylpentapeptide beta-N-acetylglucosaminyltransferase [Candidatus Syntrophosphaera sp.]|nr:undecaprenyldiphospho-muramoylpentapeptide beta-N-acetylglucosaminyltransferase [Candidatus Syntrophosphaera sp.]